MLQSPNLVMIALGAEGLLPEVEDGNHLRWQFDPELRFPRQGFDLYRRPHQAGSAVTLSPQVKSDLTARLGALYRELEVTVVHDGTGAKVVGRLWGEPMVEAGLSSWVGGSRAAEAVQLHGDAIDELLLPLGATLQQVTGVHTDATYVDPLTGELDPGWSTLLNGSIRIVLPYTEAGYPKHANSPNDAAEAMARLGRVSSAGGAVTVPTDLAARYGGQGFKDLHGLLAAGLAAGGPTLPDTPTGATVPRMRIDPYELILLAGVDPNIARILGLLWVDRSAQPGVSYDYLVIGYWVQGTKTETVCTTPGKVAPGTKIPPGTGFTPGGTIVVVGVVGGLGSVIGRAVGRLGLGEAPGRARVEPAPADEGEQPVFTLASGRGARVVEVSSPWGLDHGIELPKVRGERSVLWLSEASDRVTLRVQSQSRDLGWVARGPDGERLEVEMEVTPGGGGFTQVVITGSGIATIEVGRPVVVVQVCTSKQVPNVVTHAWISYDVVKATPAALETPSPVTGTGFPGVDRDEKPLVRPSQIKSRHGLAAGINWPLPAGSSAMLPRTSVLYHVARRSLGNASTADASVDLTDLGKFTALTVDNTNPAAPLPVPICPIRGALTQPLPDDWPSDPVRFIDGDALDRWYTYAVRGLDLFGRESATAVGTVELHDRIPPAPPVEARAMFIDKALTAADPEYDAELAALIPAAADGALLVEWSWPSHRYRQAPDAKEFRLYWQAGRLNTLSGEVTAVTAASEVSTATVSLDAGQIAKAVTDGWLRVGDEFFTITSSGTGNPVQLTVKNLRLTRDAAGQRKPPNLGRCVISLGAGETLTRPGPSAKPADPNYVDYRNPKSWAQRADVVTLLQPLEGQVGAVVAQSLSGTVAAGGWIDNGDGTSSVRLDRPLRRAAGLLAGGSLSIGGSSYAVVANGEGASAVLTVQNTGPGTPPAAPSPAPAGAFILSAAGIVEVATNITASALPAGVALADHVGGSLVTAAGEFPVVSVYGKGSPAMLTLAVQSGGATLVAGDCAWYPAYRHVIANPGLSAGASVSTGAVGISTADERDYAPDPRGDPARTGNEGAVSAPLVVVRTPRGPVSAAGSPSATVLAGQQHVYGSVPDFHSRSFYTLSWPASGTTGATYFVYRALDEALFLRDREQRRARSGHYSAQGSFDDDAGFAAWFATYSAGLAIAQADLTAAASALISPKREQVDEAWRAWAARFYPALADAGIHALANRAGNDTAFARVNAEPIRTTSFEDTLDGRSASRFLYRVRTVDAAGNQSGLSGSSLPIYIPDIVAPNPPTLLEAAAGANMVTVRWVENTESKLDHYRLYRSSSADDAEDLRSMTLHKRIAKSPSATLRTDEVAPVAVSGASGRLELADSVDPNSPRWYRLVAVDTEGNHSPPSLVMQGMAFGAPPAPISILQAAWTPSPKGLAIRAQWTPKQGVEVRLQRRAQGSSTWLSAVDWVDGSTGTADLLGAEPWLSQDVRIEARAASGNFLTAGPAVTLSAEVV